ncbi:hypothetical protein [Fischerella thermalis]|uniref:hypothetical protein n=1 Tax=Fischerella thermalis TaxID=372787 RepID=UPI000C8057B0|nr:hypothetical protein [Fischerella thermalis]PLZ27164.1 hypothetical protein CBP29_04750 [Fischerella thermalis WC341]PLZ49138.1 hypothetical protein CBP15_17790 [Fischerella thermalis WC442]PLZ84174.1 hypothetical protein CBP20_00185 [Fischerella thermalis WC213]
MNDFSQEHKALVDAIVADAEQQLADLYLSPESKEAVARSGSDNRPAHIILAKQFETVKATLNRDVEDILREITPRIGICNPGNPVYETWDDFHEVAKEPLTGFIISVISTVVPQASLPVSVAAIVVIISFYGLEKFCDRYCPNR